MKYLSFRIQNYRAIKDLTITLDKKIIPLIGINECGKTTILQAIRAFDRDNDSSGKQSHVKSLENLYETINEEQTKITATLLFTNDDRRFDLNALGEHHKFQ